MDTDLLKSIQNCSFQYNNFSIKTLKIISNDKTKLQTRFQNFIFSFFKNNNHINFSQCVVYIKHNENYSFYLLDGEAEINKIHQLTIPNELNNNFNYFQDFNESINKYIINKCFYNNNVQIKSINVYKNSNITEIKEIYLLRFKLFFIDGGFGINGNSFIKDIGIKDKVTVEQHTSKDINYGLVNKFVDISTDEGYNNLLGDWYNNVVKKSNIGNYYKKIKTKETWSCKLCKKEFLKSNFFQHTNSKCSINFRKLFKDRNKDIPFQLLEPIINPENVQHPIQQPEQQEIDNNDLDDGGIDIWDDNPPLQNATNNNNNNNNNNENNNDDSSNNKSPVDHEIPWSVLTPSHFIKLGNGNEKPVTRTLPNKLEFGEQLVADYYFNSLSKEDVVNAMRLHSESLVRKNQKYFSTFENKFLKSRGYKNIKIEELLPADREIIQDMKQQCDEDNAKDSIFGFKTSNSNLKRKFNVKGSNLKKSNPLKCSLPDSKPIIIYWIPLLFIILSTVTSHQSFHLYPFQTDDNYSTLIPSLYCESNNFKLERSQCYKDEKQISVVIFMDGMSRKNTKSTESMVGVFIGFLNLDKHMFNSMDTRHVVSVFPSKFKKIPGFINELYYHILNDLWIHINENVPLEIGYSKYRIFLSGLVGDRPGGSDFTGCRACTSSTPCINCSISLSNVNIPIPLSEEIDLEKYYKVPSYAQEILERLFGVQPQTKNTTINTNYQHSENDVEDDLIEDRPHKKVRKTAAIPSATPTTTIPPIPAPLNFKDYHNYTNECSNVDGFNYSLWDAFEKNIDDYVKVCNDKGEEEADRLFGINPTHKNKILFEKRFNFFSKFLVDGFHNVCLGSMRSEIIMISYLIGFNILKLVNHELSKLGSINGEKVPFISSQLTGKQVELIYRNRILSTIISKIISSNETYKQHLKNKPKKVDLFEDLIEMLKLHENLIIFMSDTSIDIKQKNNYDSLIKLVSLHRIKHFYIYVYFNVLLKINIKKRSTGKLVSNPKTVTDLARKHKKRKLRRKLELELGSIELYNGEIKDDDVSVFFNDPEIIKIVKGESGKDKIKLFCSAIPKSINIHLIYHLCSNILQYGNYLVFSTQLFEKLHQVLKKFLNNKTNNKNIEKSMLKFCEMQTIIKLNSHYEFDNTFSQSFYVGLKKVKDITTMNENQQFIEVKSITNKNKKYSAPNEIEKDKIHQVSDFDYIEYHISNKSTAFGRIDKILLYLKKDDPSSYKLQINISKIKYSTVNQNNRVYFLETDEITIDPSQIKQLIYPIACGLDCFNILGSSKDLENPQQFKIIK